MAHSDIHFNVIGTAGHIVLDRPKALNALSAEMVQSMLAWLARWRDDKAISHIVVSSTSERAFCAGGDIRFARDLILNGDFDKADEFFRNEYLADLAIAEFGKPVIALCNGVVMGGGAGIAEAATHIVVTETTKFAMPESGIGLFPDAGASLFLGRCPSSVSRLIGMTGHVINGADCLLYGLATVMVKSARLKALEVDLLASDAASIDSVINQYKDDASAPSLPVYRQHIDYVFADDLTAEEMRGRAVDLHQLYPDNPFIKTVADALGQRCPMSIKLFCRMMAVSRDFSTAAEALALEFRLAMRVIRRPDFAEGIRAVLIDKDGAAKWSPATLEDVTELMLADVFDATDLPPLR